MNIKDGFFLYRLKLWTYKTEIIIAIITFALSYLIFSEYNLSTLNLNEEYIPIWLEGLKLLVWTFFFILIKNLWDLISPYIINGFKERTYEFKSNDWPKKWIFQGGIECKSSPNSLIIKNSNSGCLLNRLWKNFEMSFEMKFIDKEENTLGILFRAENLENYFMLQIKYKKNEEFYINPHVRWLGDWDIFMNAKPEFEFKKNDYFNKFFKVKLQVQGIIAKLLLDGKLAYEWILPSHVEARYKQQEKNDTEMKNEKQREWNVIKIPFRQAHGMVGFRAYPYTEEAIIRNLSIKSL